MAANPQDHSWPIAHRLLLFEEPALKWLHLRRWLKRNASRQGFLNEVDANQDGQQSRMLTALFAIEEGKRFLQPAFARWRQHCDEDFADSKSFCKNQPKDADWVEVLSRYSPSWRQVAESSSGSQDPRIRFLCGLLEDLPSTSNNFEELSPKFEAALKQWRAKLPGHFLPDLIVLVEGATEAILLPILALRLGIDLKAIGAMIIPAGGANQVAKRYAQLKEILAIPIFCLLDRDAEQQRDMIASQLRREDHLYTLKEGEIEDLIRIDTLVPLINRYLASAQYAALSLKPVQESDFEPGLARTAVLEKLWRQRNLGKFDKVGFAKFVAEGSETDEGTIPQATTRPLEVHEITPDGRLLIKTLAACQSKSRTD